MIFCLKATTTFECRPFDVKSLLYYSLIDGYDYNIFAVLMCAIESQAHEYMLHHIPVLRHANASVRGAPTCDSTTVMCAS